MWLLLFNLSLLYSVGFSQDAFPSFETFSKSSSASTFELNLPSPILEPEKFSINEEARNFPEEAIIRETEDQAAVSSSRKRRQTNETTIQETSDSPADRGARNFPKEAIERGIASFDEETKRIKRDSAQDVSNAPKDSNFPNFYHLSESGSLIAEPQFPDTQEKISPLDFPFADPSLRNYPPPSVPSSAVQPLQGQKTKRESERLSRKVSKRQTGQDFPNFFQNSQSETRIISPLFPDTGSRIMNGGFEFPDPQARSFPSPDSVLRGVQRRKRQIGGQENFPNFFKISQSSQKIAGPQFPDTEAHIGSGGFGPGPLIFSSSTNFQRQKRGHKNGVSNPALYDVNYVEYLDTLSAPRGHAFFRPSRNAQNQGLGPRYPPFDPFGNTQYIPLPPSNPHFALPVSSEDPHMSRAKERFRRPLRNARFEPSFNDLDSEATNEAENFFYESSPEFNDIVVMSQLGKLHFYKRH